MTNQLILIEVTPAATADSTGSWQLDPATCEIGRRGVARARQALQEARADARTDTVSRPSLPAAA